MKVFGLVGGVRVYMVMFKAHKYGQYHRNCLETTHYAPVAIDRLKKQRRTKRSAQRSNKQYYQRRLRWRGGVSNEAAEIDQQIRELEKKAELAKIEQQFVS